MNRIFVISDHALKGFYWCDECGFLTVQWLGIIVEFDHEW